MAVVVLISGSGLKGPQVVMRRFKEAPTIRPSIEEFEKSIK